ncbi:type IV fimbrial assembly protein pilC [Candidatus Glomeribacter gigasporarum BEG34]|uniref:Type IV fimbrial assembly protein pilC n=1 Tax=Candidatus Glomeribacter gigasporarum BEG34 TaxID=1070319 RepID=G2JAC7_9BURK|nr:type II secretion system F family protein [Candidatus Glomeribacter gigasporarum]CCD29728.1 type IV fimbrial assembly protein pilC [Candidatus Glomeribacter gigasporarum BEG34]
MRPLSSAPEASDARFAWRGADAHGRLRRGVLVAAHAADVRAVLKRQRIVAIEIIRKGAARPGRVRSAEITLFSRQLANLLQAGIPLLSALNIMAASDASAALARVVQAIARDIVQGLHFSAALARHRCFDALYCQLVAVGEASGSLAELLAQLANDRERSAAQKAKLRAALSYPAGVLLLALLITVALMIWVVPTFEQVFDGFGAALPAPTRVVLALSSATARAIAPASLAMVALCLGCSFGLRRSSALRAAFDRLLLMPPIVGPLLRQWAIARWSRALGTLLKAGTPLADAFEVMSNITGNTVFDRATHTIARAVRRGARLTDAMRAVGCFPPSVLQTVSVAEESGALDAMLNDIATLNSQQLDRRIEALAGLVEPLIIVVLGALIGGLVVALYLPIIQLGNVI